MSFRGILIRHLGNYGILRILIFLQTEITLLKHKMVGKSCKDLKLKYNLNETGEYFIQPNINDTSNSNITIYCDLENDGGGWSVIQRRGVRDIPKAQRQSFNKSWVEYEDGFGSVLDDHWIGLKNIYLLTHQDNCGTELMVTLTKWDGLERYAKHGNFSISGSEDHYRLSISDYEGNATDQEDKTIYTMLYNSKAKFSTYDRNNNDEDEENCVENQGGASWHKGGWCTSVALNGEYSEDGKMGDRHDYSAIYWMSNSYILEPSFMKTQMKIKSNC